MIDELTTVAAAFTTGPRPDRAERLVRFTVHRRDNTNGQLTQDLHLDTNDRLLNDTGPRTTRRLTSTQLAGQHRALAEIPEDLVEHFRTEIDQITAANAYEQHATDLFPAWETAVHAAVAQGYDPGKGTLWAGLVILTAGEEPELIGITSPEHLTQVLSQHGLEHLPVVAGAPAHLRWHFTGYPCTPRDLPDWVHPAAAAAGVPTGDIVRFHPDLHAIHSRGEYALVDTFGRVPGSPSLTEEQFAARQEFIDQLRTACACPPELDQPMTTRR